MINQMKWLQVICNDQLGDARRAPKAGPKGRQLEVGAQRAPRLLVFNIWNKLSAYQLDIPLDKEHFLPHQLWSAETKTIPISTLISEKPRHLIEERVDKLARLTISWYLDLLLMVFVNSKKYQQILWRKCCLLCIQFHYEEKLQFHCCNFPVESCF